MSARSCPTLRELLQSEIFEELWSEDLSRPSPARTIVVLVRSMTMLFRRTSVTNSGLCTESNPRSHKLSEGNHGTVL